MTPVSRTIGRVGFCLLALLALASAGVIIGVVPAPGDVPVDPELQELIISQFDCDKSKPFATCVSEGTASLIQTAGTGISLALVTGELPETKLGPLVISGENIELSGVETLDAKGAVFQGSTLFLTLTLDELNMEGDFKIKIPILGRRPMHLALRITGLETPMAIVMDVRDGKLVIVDFNLKVTFDSIDIEINRGGPIVSPKIPFSGMINGIAKSFLRGLTKKHVLQNKILPLVLKAAKPSMLKLINGFLQGGGASAL